MPPGTERTVEEMLEDAPCFESQQHMQEAMVAFSQGDKALLPDVYQRRAKTMCFLNSWARRLDDMEAKIVEAEAILARKADAKKSAAGAVATAAVAEGVRSPKNAHATPRSSLRAASTTPRSGDPEFSASERAESGSTASGSVSISSSHVVSAAAQQRPVGPLGRHRMRLIMVIFRKPKGPKLKEQHLAQQNFLCGDCQCVFEKKWSVSKLGVNWDVARFDYFTGMYYCHACHGGLTGDGTVCRIIPARAVHAWDFSYLPVCKESAKYLSNNLRSPVLCLSALRPELYSIPVIRCLQQIRVQLMILFDTVKTCGHYKGVCEAYRSRMDRDVEGMHGEDATEALYADIPLDKITLGSTESPGLKHYMENSEFWSLQDMIEVHSVVPSIAREAPSTADSPPLSARSASPSFSGGGSPKLRAAATGSTPFEMCPLLLKLKKVRSLLIEHIVHQCPSQCFPAAARKCPQCTDSAPVTNSFGHGVGAGDAAGDGHIFAFDLLNCATCTKCSTVHHRVCFRMWGCKRCAEEAPGQNVGSP